MPWWVERPSRALAALEAAAVALGVAYPIAGILIESPLRLDRLFLGVALIAFVPIAIGVLVLEQPMGLVHVLRRARFAWAAPLTVAALFVTGLLDWSGWSRPVGLAVASASFVAGIWSLTIFVRARDWVSGELELGPDLRVRDGGATYLLERAPEGATLGSWLTFPDVSLVAQQRGPYRSGRPHGRAPSVILLPLVEVRRRLLWHALAFLLWAMVGATSVIVE